MLRKFLEKICEEFAVVPPKIEANQTAVLRLGNESISIRDLDPGAAFHAHICELPQKKQEELLLYLSRANLLGQGTGGARIGMDTNEKFLTLSLGLPYELDYQMFREGVEDFINYVIYWRDEIGKFENEQRMFK